MKDKILKALTAALQAQYGCNVSVEVKGRA